MNITRTTVALLLLAALGVSAQAQSAKTRQQVKAETAEAIRTGNMVASGESGLKLNELYPQRYAAHSTPASLTRADVKAALADAIRTGDIVAAGEGAQKLNQQSPQRYPSVAVASGKTRQEVKAETLEAIRNGDIIAVGERGLKLNEAYPKRYDKTHAQASSNGSHQTAASGAGAVVR